MKYTTLLIIVATLCCSTRSYPEENAVLLPGGLHFAPLKANMEEARSGLFKFTNSSDMVISIGNTIDLYGLSLPRDNMRVTAGVDFMAFGYSVSYERHMLQIDAMDGLFGINLCLSKSFDESAVFARLRLLHLSSHFVDDHFYDGRLAEIPFLYSARMYSKDFAELVVARSVSQPAGILRYYGGCSYSVYVRPGTLRRWTCMAGGEFANGTVMGEFFGIPSNLFCAYQVSLNTVPAYVATHQLQAGIKFGEWYTKGVTVYASYVTGQNMFGEYYDARISTIGIGFMVDFL